MLHINDFLMRRALLAAIGIALLARGVAPHAQARPESVLRDYETVKLADGVYAFIAPESKTPVVSGNSLVVIGDDGVLVVDSTNVPSLARRMIADIKRWTNKPVRVLVNTHWHFDHVMGNAAYQEAFPGVAIVATAGMRVIADTQVPGYFEQTIGPSTAATIDALRSMLRAGKKPNGAELSATDREFYELEIADYDAWVAELKQTHFVAPTITFDRTMDIRLGKRDVRILFLGPGNTTGDAVVYVPDAKVVATGDLLVGPTPYATDSFLREWIGTMDHLMALDATSIVPGHGPVEHDWEHARTTQKLLRTVVDQVDDAVRKGLSLDDTRKQVNVTAFRDRMVGANPFRARAFDTFFLTTAVERAYRDAMYRAEK